MNTTENIASILKKLRISNNLTLEEVGDKIGVNKSTIQRWETGKGTMSIKIPIIEALASIYNTTPQQILGNYNNFNVVSVNKEDIVMIPVVDKVRAGYFEEKEIKGFEPTLKSMLSNNKEYFYLKLIGDSMLPKFQNGDLLLIQRKITVKSGSYAVVLIDGLDGVVRKINYGNDWTELISENPYYPIRRFEGEDIFRVSTVGLVEMLVRKSF